jgi:TPR repeat protein
MRTSRVHALISIALSAVVIAGATMSAMAQDDAVDAAQALASALDGAGGGISSADQIAALEAAAAAGDPGALWQLANMYENGQGVPQDKAKAFGYFSQIADQRDDGNARRFDPKIVAESILKVGEYYREGLPEAGVEPDADEYEWRVQYAANVLGNADAQYQLGELYSDDGALGDVPMLSYRWLLQASRKGHALAQAELGNLLFNGRGTIQADPVKGLMWLSVASRRAVGTPEQERIDEMLDADMSIASPAQRAQAVEMADSLFMQFASLSTAAP